MTDPRSRPKRATVAPAWLTEAQHYYGSNLMHEATVKGTRAYAEAMDDFAELEEGKQRFILAHLLVLNLRAHGAAYGQRVRLHREAMGVITAVGRRVVKVLRDLSMGEDPDADQGSEGAAEPAEPSMAGDAPIIDATFEEDDDDDATPAPSDDPGEEG